MLKVREVGGGRHWDPDAAEEDEGVEEGECKG